jgi:hypothetical protein
MSAVSWFHQFRWKIVLEAGCGNPEQTYVLRDNPKGVEGMFNTDQVIQIVGILNNIRMTAEAQTSPQNGLQ